MNPGDIRLRKGDPGDVEFIYRVVEATMRGYVEQTWGSFSEEYNRKSISDSIAGGIYSIIVLGGQDVGALAVERHPAHIQLTQIYIHPSHQNRGIGTHAPRSRAGARSQGSRKAPQASRPVGEPGAQAVPEGGIPRHVAHAGAGVYGTA